MTIFESVDLSDENIMLTRELLAAGYHDKAITRLVRRGELLRIRHGAFTFPVHWDQLDGPGRRRLVAVAVLRTARSPVALCGPNAADVLGAPVWDPDDQIHLLRLDGKAGRREAGRVEHRGQALCEDLTVRDGLPVTAGTRTAIDMLSITDSERALVTINGLLHSGETTLDLIARRAAAMKWNPQTLKDNVVLRLADPRIESAGESRSSWLFWCQHLPKPIPQFEVVDGRGRVVARVDFAWPDLGAFLEFDGKEKYLRHRRPGESVADAVLRERRRELLICGITGWRCIRITWADLFEPERTAARIVAVLQGGQWAA
jgi:hypothetical protein